MNLTAHKRQGLRELMKTLPVFQRTATLPSMMSGLRLFARAVLVVALTCGGAPAQDAASIKVLQRQTLGADEIYKQHATPHAARHELNLALVYFSGSSWCVTPSLRQPAKQRRYSAHAACVWRGLN